MLRYFRKISATLHRYVDGSWDADGNWSAGTTADSTVRVIPPQPITGRDLELIPDGEHVRDYAYIWVTSEIQTRVGKKDADEFTINGSRYKAFTVEDWQIQGNYDKVIIRRIQPDE